MFTMTSNTRANVRPKTLTPHDTFVQWLENDSVPSLKKEKEKETGSYGGKCVVELSRNGAVGR
jgi:hypothetical protein